MLPDDQRQSILGLLNTYRDNHPAEHEVVDDYLLFIRKHEDCFQKSLAIGHVTGSALILNSDSDSVLLTHHKKLERWLQPGGHADGDCDVAAVAMREAEEESGLERIEFVASEILDVDIHRIPERKSEPEHFHYDCRFLLRSVGSDKFVISEESNDLKWAAMDRVTEYTDEESILRMIQKAQSIR